MPLSAGEKYFVFTNRRFPPAKNILILPIAIFRRRKIFCFCQSPFSAGEKYFGSGNCWRQLAKNFLILVIAGGDRRPRKRYCRLNASIAGRCFPTAIRRPQKARSAKISRILAAFVEKPFVGAPARPPVLAPREPRPKARGY